MTKDSYAADIYEIAVETFELMCYMFPLEDTEIDKIQKPAPGKFVVSVVRFEGPAEGVMAMCASPELMNALAENMLGTDLATQEEKEGALCEIVNIICGNVAPFFSKDDEICVIRPPWIVGPGEKPEEMFRGMNRETVTLHLDEGSAEIIVYYLCKEEPV